MRVFLLALSFIAFFAMPAAAAGLPANFDVHGIITAANQGSPSAQYQLGLMLMSGQGVTQDRQKAGIWFDRAAKQGHDGAQFMLAKLILDKTVQGNKTAAYSWLLLCSRNGEKDRVALREQVEAQLPPELIPVLKKRALMWKPTLEQVQILAPPPPRPAQQ